MHALIARMLARLAIEPRIDVVFPDGTLRSVGHGAAPRLRMRILDAPTELKLALDPELALGEAVMDGRVVVEQGSLYDLLDALVAAVHRARPQGWGRMLESLRTALRRFQQHNTLALARRNVAHHYDLKSDFFRLFLDPDMQYSCAYFADPGMTLAQAQAAKKRHIMAKLDLKPGQRVLDIGCGWGGMALSIAGETGASVTGITLSEEQLAIAEQRGAGSGLPVAFRLQDYRQLTETFDRVVSVGMFEHVGVAYYRDYFRKLRELMTEDGVALIHTIGRSTPPGATNPFIAKYIFPGGYIPAMSEVAAAIEQEGLIVTDVEVLRLHYAETLKAWRENFLARRDEAVRMYDERFARMWEFYLAASEATFRHDDLVVFQFQLARRLDGLPITRDYAAARETELAHAAG
ncbi:cyclopropane-fatty-acyl-phospholipid synthase family protein [Bosea sp. (in: a-proteobacteria)]|uniref:SAM-dependent methyltransferase n=1 Tax=Bosea sp. (in: a-proteobacteria) TaxID=1871050 RepID=UPI0026351772|nr:cyclopropane-fatty-acyl-phospholipid synthase family protein [Bosea sp. (in: a-proteobacteria)]MCO5089413.1 cyclopropane-fatty-acyl-phospholipid synthase family protein [Bosea sp. (in: a-proteobacteria)]